MKSGLMVLIIAILFSATMLITGCAGQSRLAMDYGTSFKNAKFSQTLDPDAEKNLEPVHGMDGPSAHITMERYRASFNKCLSDAQPPAMIINIGK